jgi:6-phosphofructokinase 1
MEASFDVASMCATSTKIFVLEVMGRHAGWIAAAGATEPNPGQLSVTGKSLSTVFGT